MDIKINYTKLSGCYGIEVYISTEDEIPMEVFKAVDKALIAGGFDFMESGIEFVSTGRLYDYYGKMVKIGE